MSMTQEMRDKRRHQFRPWVLTGVGIVLSLGTGCLLLSGNRHSQLIAFFAYMSVACTVVPLPTPPYVIALGAVFHPGIVALVGALGNCLAAFVEYYVLAWLFSRAALQRQVKANRTFQRFAHYFQRSAFFSLVFTGFTPIPFEPFRLAAILIRYNMSKYLLAVFIGRFPRYYLVALIGYRFPIPTHYLIAMLIVLLVVPVIGTVVKGRISASNRQ
jgi:membrane protein YqaA with SNARE-associated domain